MNLKPYITSPENAMHIAHWLRVRGGIAIWESIDLSRAGEIITTPANTSEGEPFGRPEWWVAATPECVITDLADVLISKDVEVKRVYRIKLRVTGEGKIACTEESSRRIRAAVAKAGKGAYHVFDNETRQVVIMKPKSQTTLLAYLIANGKAVGIHLVKTDLQETGKGEYTMRSDAEILESLSKTLQEDERDGSIHSNPPSEHYLAAGRTGWPEERQWRTVSRSCRCLPWRQLLLIGDLAGC